MGHAMNACEEKWRYNRNHYYLGTGFEGAEDAVLSYAGTK